MTRTIATLLSLLLLSAPAFAQPSEEGRALSIEDCITYALRHSAAVKNAQLDILRQRAVNDEITSAALPQISGQGKFTDYINPVVTFVPGEFFGQPGTFAPVVFTPKYANTIGASGSQLLFNGGVLVALQAREATVQLARQSATLTAQEVRYAVTRAYYALVIAQRQFRNLQSSLVLARDAAHDVSVLRETGYAEKIDVDRSSVQVNNLATDSLRVANALDIAEQMLKFSMSMPINQQIVLTDTAVEQNIEAAAQQLSDEAEYTQYAEYNVLQTTLKLNHYNLKRYQYDRLPSLAAFGAASYSYSTNEFNGLFGSHYPFTSLVGLQLDVPIFSGFARNARIRQAKIDIDKTVNNIENARLGIDFQASLARSSLRNALLTLKSQESNVALANSILDLARVKYKAGVGSNLELTQSQSDLLQSQNAYFQSLLDAVNAQTTFLRSIGQYQLPSAP